MVHGMKEKKFSKLAIFGFAFSFILAIVGLIMCIVAINKIDDKKHKGKGLAISGIVISIINMILTIIL